MRLPLYIDPEFKSLEACSSERDLYEKLSGTPDRLARFFIQVVVDETWAASHEAFMALSLAYFTTLYIQDRISMGAIKEVVKAFHKHHSVLSRILPRNYQIKVANELFLVNPMIVGAMSPYLQDLMNNPSNRTGLHLSDISSESAKVLFHYMEEGSWEGIWRYDRREIELWLSLVERFKLVGLTDEFQGAFVKYADLNNVSEMLLSSIQKRRTTLKKALIDYFNREVSVAKLYDLGEAGLGFEFLDAHDKALGFFKELLSKIGEVKLSGALPKNGWLFEELSKGDKIVSLNLSQSEVFNDALFSIPRRVCSLNLSRCEWLSDALFKEIARKLPWISKLDLSYNTQLTLRAWVELKSLAKLEELNITGLHHLSEAELSLIRSSVPQGAHLIQGRVSS